ncbi:MAG TPA: S8 family serine peptidase [Gaiellaceae bacterium]|nr:S8 family serine peptidase [Gaiellaceae bacterium]
MVGGTGSRRAASVTGLALVVALGAFAPRTHGSHAGFTESLHSAPAAVKSSKLDSRLLARVRETGSVAVEIRARRSAAARALVQRLGGTVHVSYRGLVEATVPSNRVAVLARDPAVRFVSEPLRPVPEAIRGEGVASTGAARWHAAGLRGAGARVAIVDVGFAGWRESRENGDLPRSTVTVNLCPGLLDGPGAFDHGTAVAEIVAEMAPAARLYLICVENVAALGQAKEYAKAHGIQIVNHSASWFNSSRGDSSGAADTPAGIVADARAAGILWVNAAGNRAQQHWSGTFSDPDGDGWHEFAPEDEGNTIVIPPGTRSCLALKWDGWPGTAVDYDLYLVRDSDRVPVASSTTAQTGTQPPTELLCYGNPVPGRAYGIAIRGHEAAAAPRLDLFVYPSPNLEYQVAEGSVTEPGSSAAALTVGAVCWQNDGLEPYSSRGPTIDGRVKPDLVAPDWVSSFSYGRFEGCGAGSGFAGTSAATPHVAGAAALVKSENPSFGPNELQAFLETHAVDLGAPGRDSSFGAGRLALGPPPRTILRACIVPRVRGLRLAAARSSIVRSGCSVGRVRKARSRIPRGRVLGQRPSAGHRLAPHGRVNLTVSR